jgi:hypothetical protein
MPEMCNGPDAGSNRDCRGAKAMHKCSCSRIRPGLFLGCKCCEQCPSMIKQLGVTHVLQVGWSHIGGPQKAGTTGYPAAVP